MLRSIGFVFAGVLLFVVSQTALGQGEEQMRVMREAAMRQQLEQQGKPPEGAPNKPPTGKPEDSGEKKPDDKKPDENSKPGQASVVTRPAAGESADPTQLRIKPDAEGRIQLQMNGQRWLDVLQFLADWSELALDWTELPGDAVNLSTARKYSLDEARDLFNRMLLDRGYTILLKPGTLSVHNVTKLNPALIPRCQANELENYDRHAWVKVLLPLGHGLVAEPTAKDLEVLKSQHGKLIPLNSSNRIEAIDTVGNVMHMRDMLTDEVSAKGAFEHIQVFTILHRSAADVDKLLRPLLGLKAATEAAGPITPQQMQMQMQMAQMRAQQQKQNKGAVPESEESVRLVVNQRENAIIAYAPPDKMPLIEQAIKAIDKPIETVGNAQSNSLKFRTYKLSTMDPAPLVKMLSEIGELGYNTRLEVDTKNKAIIAFASLADHFTIDSLVKRLDSSGRTFHVRKLKRLRADYVAGTISFMMGVKKEDDSSSNRRRYYWYGDDQKEEETSKFTVDADVQNNWLLLRANELEMEEIEGLLVQLGEIRIAGADDRTVRYLDIEPGEATEQMLERIRRIWPDVAPNDLEIEPAPELESDEDASEPSPELDLNTDETHARKTADATTMLVQLPLIKEAADGDDAVDGENETNESTQNGKSDSADSEPAKRDFDPEVLRRFLESVEQEENTKRPSPSNADEPNLQKRRVRQAPPPVRITRGPNGKIVISCQDPSALDALEDLLNQQAPRPSGHRIIRLRYADAFDVKYVLEKYFEKEDDDNNNSRRGYYYYWDDYGSNDSSDKSRRLSDRAEVKFILDTATNSIVVKDADGPQWKTIEDLVTFYDRPEPSDAQTRRMMEYYELDYAKADTVVQRIKEVFIDLLSTNDKARQQDQDKNRPERVVNYNFGDSDSQKVPKFKGQLHVTADSGSNTIVVLAPKYVLDWVRPMIEQLEESARPSSTVKVMKVGANVNPAMLQQAITRLLQQGQQENAQKGKEGQPQPGQPNGQPPIGNRG